MLSTPHEAGEIECLSAGLLVADHLCTPISHLPRAGELVLADRLELTIGGCASNVAIDLARLGVRVAAVGCVGRDSFGEFVIDTLQRSGVDTRSIRQLDDVATSGTLIVNVAGEDRRFIHAIGANGRLAVEHVPIDRLLASRVFYVGGYFVLPGLDPGRLAALFRQARSAGVKTVLDVVMSGPGDHWPQLRELLRETDVFLPNVDEAAIITGHDNPREQALRLHDAGARTVVITCGGEGTVVVGERERLHAPAHKVTFVGGTGAGDAFDAGFIAGLIEGADVRRCLEWGSALGASCVRSISATESVFTRAEALEFMRTHPLRVAEW
ncbi:MAG TPA: sugar kinase [Pirellulales bacterium]|jgi:sugar/nucleoside kinase (ribokinase family)|nr:sugar kinase [Pirellulales bacterium]